MELISVFASVKVQVRVECKLKVGGSNGGVVQYESSLDQIGVGHELKVGLKLRWSVV